MILIVHSRLLAMFDLNRSLVFVLLLIANHYAIADAVSVGAVAPDVLAISVQNGQVILGKQVPYKAIPLVDQVVTKEGQPHRWVVRAGKTLGTLVGKSGNTLFTYDQFVSSPFDERLSDMADTYSVVSDDDPQYRDSTQVLRVFRKSRPTNMAQTGVWEFQWAMEHNLYLQLPYPLRAYCTYHLKTRQNFLPSITYKHLPKQNVSEAVHVSQVGFRPDDSVKVGFLSVWRGSGGGQTYTANLQYQLINVSNNTVAMVGSVRLSRSSLEAEDGTGRNYNLADIYVMDFSDFSRTGTYRLCVDNIGCSLDFPIRRNAWDTAFYTSVRGLLHERSGIALGPPFTSYKRPRNMHPDDGLRVYHTTTPLLDTMNGLNARGEDKSNFYLINKNRTHKLVLNTWGGYADAGDWDRRAQHLRISVLLIELLEMFPAHFSSLKLNLPYADSQLPDVLNEALWGIDFFRRMQEADGGIRGGVELDDHPRRGEASWQESQIAMAYAPDMWSSYLYVGAAVRAANALSTYDRTLSSVYLTSAQAAMGYAERVFAKHSYSSLPHEVNDARNFAALELYRLTGEDAWHKLFLATSAFAQSGHKLAEWKSHAQSDAAFLYLRLQRPVDNQVRDNMMKAFKLTTGEMIEQCGKTGFRWTKDNPDAWLGWGSLSVPQALNLVRMHFLQQDAETFNTALYASQFGAGANPLNMTMTTGVGKKYPLNPLHQDYRVSNQTAPPGITVNGPHDVQKMDDSWTLKVLGSHLYPSLQKWPTTEFYLDIYAFEPITEFGVDTTIAQNAYIWGYLSARGGKLEAK